jgi:uncharacterized membrane protein
MISWDFFIIFVKKEKNMAVIGIIMVVLLFRGLIFLEQNN